MKNISLWMIVGAVALFVLGLFGGLFVSFGLTNSDFGFGCAEGWNSYGMMGYRGSMPMMGGWGMVPFGFLGMLFMGFIPLGTLALVLGGIFWVGRALTQKPA
ncbi:MAG: hypothetical protein Fur0022_00230 [Anaerolineales bacterium]